VPESLTLTLDQFKLIHIGEIVSCEDLPGHAVRLRTADGSSYLVLGVSSLSTSEQVTLHATGDSLVLSRKRSRHRDAATLLAGTATTLAALSLVFVLRSSPPASVAQRIQELGSVQHSLRELDKYLSDQQLILSHLSHDVGKLQREKADLSRVVELNQHQVESLLEYQNRQQDRRQILSIILSFIVGVTSSVTATLLIGLRRRRSSSKRAGERAA
jgi:hypothetical protein